MTVLDLVKRSLRLLGALNIGDTPTNDEAQDLLVAVNSLVDAWATQRLLCYSTARNLYPFAPGQGQYQIGPGPQVGNVPPPDWVAPRPLYIDRATLWIPSADPTQSYERPLHVLRTNTEWARVRIKGLLSTLPTKLFYDRWYSYADPANGAVTDVGSGNIAVWPVPTVSGLQCVLYTPQAVSQFTNLTQLISLPPGYARALAYNLAVEVAAEFGKEAPESVMAIAEQTKADLKRANAPNVLRQLRTDIGHPHGSRFDYVTGEQR